jgi:[ribosomal protein S5]-alanine N-acetyltransferase
VGSVIELRAGADGRGELIFDTSSANADELVAAARGIVRDAFEAGRMRQLTWRAPVGDTVARRTAWALGLTFEGVNRSGWVMDDGTLVDAWTGTLLPDDTLEPTTRWLEPIDIVGDRVALRGVAPKDEQRYLETNNDAESMQWLATVPMARDVQAFRQRLLNITASPSLGTAVEWTITDRETDVLVGNVSLFGLGGLDYKSAEVGYRTHPDSRGRGFLTEALRLVIAHAFTSEDAGGLGLERIHLGAGDGNAPSQGVARSLGFTETGRDRRCYELADGSIVDLIRFDLLVSEWRSAAGRPSR